MEKSAYMRDIYKSIDVLRESDLCVKQLAELKSLCQSLEDKEFTISVIGQTNQDKNVFINAFLDEAILPVDIFSVVVAQIEYGEKSAVISTSDGDQSLPYDELFNYDKKETNEQKIMFNFI